MRNAKKHCTLLVHLLCSVYMLIALAGCSPAAFVAGVATGSAVGADRRTLKSVAHDQAIKQRIHLAWQADPLLSRKTHLTVATFNGVVLLVGQVHTEMARQRAYQLAARVPSVRRIYNQIQVMPLTTMVTRSNDTWITTKIKSLLLAEKHIPSTHVKVVTENGVVYLMGILKPLQGKQVADVARRVSGVKKVVKIFEYDRNTF